MLEYLKTYLELQLGHAQGCVEAFLRWQPQRTHLQRMDYAPRNRPRYPHNRYDPAQHFMQGTAPDMLIIGMIQFIISCEASPQISS